MSEENPVQLELLSVDLADLIVKRSFDVEPTGGSGSIELKVEKSDDDFAVDAHCRVTLTAGEEESLVTVQCAYRVAFDPKDRDQFEQNLLADTVAEVALRVAYPFLRAAITDAIARTGVPGFMLPLMGDDEWARIVASAHEENAEVKA